MNNIPILEYDPAPTAVIEPHVERFPTQLPDKCVLCFFPEVLQKLADGGQLQPIGHMYIESGHNPVYHLEIEGQTLTVTHPGVGGPVAAFYLEILIANGCQTFVACGGAGVLHNDLAMGHVIVPTTAVRDEGTSYHYLPPSREVAASADMVAVIERTLQARHVPFTSGKTWTTDAIFRETRARVDRRRAEGCLTVEMEAATFFAVAQHRGARFGQLLYGGDDLSGDEWDERDWIRQPTTRERLFWLAVDACLAA